MIFPLKNHNLSVPILPEVGAFGVKRKFDIHTGIDLYCDDGSTVLAIEDGTVVGIIPFTGDIAGYPWWENTYAVLIQGKSGTFLYGEIYPPVVKLGQSVKAGEEIASVKRVLKKDKGLPMSMLHLELYKTPPFEGYEWLLDQAQPDNLLDPTKILNLCIRT